ncbi:MAG: CidA/LrgA family protein [Pigmentiphaga sp.]|uniref:CidA/LrgA family protein n=1 Tax=Pigmentiphaga sp. TaxID=1977564 RepID=UPI0029A8BE75|nr:CidA/LrgA family protein [Pigmentiphaga sp.]MDX3905691.1 CidA/LrgA family protein [Pigmentiphaga sp.]
MQASRFSILTARITQVLALVAVWWAADELVRRIGLPIPGGVVGLFVVLALLLSGKLPLHRIDQGARWLLADMLVFFVPAAVAMVRYRDLLASEGLKLLAVIVLGNACVMLATALTVEWAVRRRRVRARPPARHEEAA